MADTFGKYLKELRLNSGLTLKEVENITGISNAYLSQIERSHRIPTMLFLCGLADAYGVKFSDLADVAHGYLKRNGQIEKSKDLSPKAQSLGKTYDKLLPEHQVAIAQMVNALAKKPPKK